MAVTGGDAQVGSSDDGVALSIPRCCNVGRYEQTYCLPFFME